MIITLYHFFLFFIIRSHNRGWRPKALGSASTYDMGPKNYYTFRTECCLGIVLTVRSNMLKEASVFLFGRLESFFYKTRSAKICFVVMCNKTEPSRSSRIKTFSLKRTIHLIPKTAAILVFFCLLANQPLLPRLNENFSLEFRV